MTRAENNHVVGILLMVLGALVAIGVLGLGLLVTIGAILAIVVGVFALVEKGRKAFAYGLVLVLVGALVLSSPYLHVGLTFLLNIVAGAILILVGYLKYDGKW